MKSHKYPLPLQSNHPTSIHTKPHLHKPQSIQKHIIFTSLFSAMISKHSKSTHKTRTKLHKPKYLSLNHLTTTTPTPPPPMPTTNHHDHKHQQQLTLFPLHPENLVEQDHNMASIFSSCDNITTTLTQILCSENDDNENPNPSPSSVNYAQENVDLVRTAMRKTKTENIDQNNDEKWVCYSEVCSSISSTTTTSCHHINHCNDVDNNNNNDNNYRSKLVLKLDYEKIMKSWVNKGPLFIRGGSDVDAPYPQTVPDLHDDHFFLHSSINVTPHVDQDDDDGNAGSWTVPEMTHNENNGISRGDDALQAGESSVMGHKRKASVQRYKEKRRNRLFAKTVRYEVRKLNAQKRPRIKGRFVKSS